MKKLIYFFTLITFLGTLSCSKNETAATYIPVAPDYSKEEMWYNLITLNEGGFAFPAALEPYKARLIAVVVLFGIALVAALFVFIWSICSNKRIPVLVASALGIVSAISMTGVFNSVAKLLMDGTINVIELFTSNWIISLLGEIIVVDYIGFAGFHNAIIFLFVGIIVWTLSFYLVELGEPKEEKSKEKVKKK
jgi:hypothetical protein